MAYHLLPLLLKPAVAGAAHAVVADRLAHTGNLGSLGLAGWLDSPIDTAASEAAAMFEAKVIERMPFILSELRPQLNESAKEAMRAAFADEGLQQAIQTTKQDFALALAATALAAGVISYVLVKYA